MINGIQLRPLKAAYQEPVGFELVLEKAAQNGRDEIFFEHQGQKYVAIARDGAAISDMADTKRQLRALHPSVSILSSSDEINSGFEKFKNTTVNVITGSIFEGIGGGAAGAFVSKVGLQSKAMKAAIAVGAVSAFVKEGVSVVLGDLNEYKKAESTSLERFLGAEVNAFTPQSPARQIPVPQVAPARATVATLGSASWQRVASKS